MTQSALVSWEENWVIIIPFSQRCLRRVPSFPRNSASRYLRLSLRLTGAVATVARRGLALTSDGSLRGGIVRAVAVVTPPAGSLGARVGVIGSAGATGSGAGVGDKG